MADAESRRARLLAIFRAEADEHLHLIAEQIAILIGIPAGAETQAILETLFRTFHTLKGAARSVGFLEIEQVCDSCEGLLRDLTRGSATFASSIPAVLQEASDALTTLVAGTASDSRTVDLVAAIDRQRVLSQPSIAPAEPMAAPAPDQPDPPEPVVTAAPAAPLQSGDGERSPPAAAASERRSETPLAPTEFVRVEVGRLDRLVLLSEELLVRKLASAERARAARVVADTVSEMRLDLESRVRRRVARDPEAAAWDSAIARRLRELETDLRRHHETLVADQKAIRSAVDDLMEQTTQVRMMPFSSVIAAFPAMVRDLARESGKEVEWSVRGADLLVDRKVTDLIKDPLIHMVRNAVDHGIEPPAQRQANGKPRMGSISLTVAPAEGGRFAIELRDDGKGFSVDNLRAAALRARIGSAEQIAAMSDEQIRDMAFRAGVSTSPVITRISGNGLGLAIVRERIERIDGRIETELSPGAGTLIRIVVPTTVATARGLQLQVGGLVCLCPMEFVERTMSIPARELPEWLGRGVIICGQETVPFGRLAAILGQTSSVLATESGLVPGIVIRVGDRRAVLAADAILGEAEVLIKEFSSPLRRVLNFAAAGLMGTGDLILILRPSDLLDLIRHGAIAGGRGAGEGESRSARVLVVDDSITTRTMERNLLEAAGYEVRTAVDGADAWNILQTDPIDLVVSDVDMPRMNGFELTEHIRASGRFAELPVVLVTALESREDKEKGIGVGANAYVLKSGFDQSNLLEIVGRLV